MQELHPMEGTVMTKVAIILMPPRLGRNPGKLGRRSKLPQINHATRVGNRIKDLPVMEEAPEEEDLEGMMANHLAVTTGPRVTVLTRKHLTGPPPEQGG